MPPNQTDNSHHPDSMNDNHDIYLGTKETPSPPDLGISDDGNYSSPYHPSLDKPMTNNFSEQRFEAKAVPISTTYKTQPHHEELHINEYKVEQLEVPQLGSSTTESHAPPPTDHEGLHDISLSTNTNTATDPCPPCTPPTPTPTSMQLNTAFLALETMRVHNLEIEFGRSVDLHCCVHCLRGRTQRSVPSALLPKRSHRPCLLCGSPTCRRHASSKFRKESKITVCSRCDPLFGVDYVLQCIRAEGEEARVRFFVGRMVDVYDRVLLVLRYSVQFIDETVAKLEKGSGVRDRVGIGGSTSGLFSGIAGVAAAAAILTPAGPPLLIASLLFGGTAQACVAGTKTVNYYSSPRRLAAKIIAYYNLCKSVLFVTCVLRDALMSDRLIDLENYVDNVLKGVEEMQGDYGYRDDDNNDDDDDDDYDDDMTIGERSSSDDSIITSQTDNNSLSRTPSIVMTSFDEKIFSDSSVESVKPHTYPSQGESEQGKPTTPPAAQAPAKSRGFLGRFTLRRQKSSPCSPTTKELTSSSSPPPLARTHSTEIETTSSNDGLLSGSNPLLETSCSADNNTPHARVVSFENRENELLPHAFFTTDFDKGLQGNDTSHLTKPDAFDPKSQPPSSPPTTTTTTTITTITTTTKTTNQSTKTNSSSTPSTTAIIPISPSSQPRYGATARYMSRTSLSSGGLAGIASVASLAGGALSAIHIAFEAKTFASTFRRIRMGSPCDRAKILRKIKEEVEKLPSTEVVAREWEDNFERLRERRREGESEGLVGEMGGGKIEL